MLRKQVEIIVGDDLYDLQVGVNELLQCILPENVINITVFLAQNTANIIYLKNIEHAS